MGSRSLKRQRKSRRYRPWLTTVIGAIVGFLVSLTSVGGGSLIIACIGGVVPKGALRRMVGSDIVHALVLVGVAGIHHLGMGALIALCWVHCVGSVPSVVLGSRMTALVPEMGLPGAGNHHGGPGQANVSGSKLWILPQRSRQQFVHLRIVSPTARSCCRVKLQGVQQCRSY